MSAVRGCFRSHRREHRRPTANASRSSPHATPYGETCFEDCSPNGEVYVADADGSNLTRVTRTTASETAPAWSPDGRRIAFTSDRNAPGNGSEIYSVGVDGTCMTWLTNGPLQSGAPAWEPGSGLDSDPGGCGAVRRKPTTGDVRPARPRMPFPAYWVGSDFRHQLLTNVGELLTGSKVVDLRYDDCGVYEPARCSGSIELQNASICARHPLSFGGREPVPGGQVLATARFKRRGVLAAYFPSAGGWDIYTGSTTVTVFGASRADVKGIVDALRPIGGGNRRLPAPAFPAREFWAKLDAVIRMYRQLGSVSAVALRLEIEERTVEDRLAWARLLADYHRPSRHRCSAAERGRQLGPAPQY